MDLFVSQIKVNHNSNQQMEVIGKLSLLDTECIAYGDGTLNILQRILMRTIGDGKLKITLDNHQQWFYLLQKYVGGTYNGISLPSSIRNKYVSNLPETWRVDFKKKKVIIADDYYDFYYIYFPRFKLGDFKVIKG